MNRLWLIPVALVALAGAVWAVGLGPFARTEAATFHVDYEHGLDTGDGLTVATAWKHAPGDPVARAGPARTKLRPGDEVIFAANVRYRGSVLVNASGTKEAPIVFSGAGPSGAAVIDGSDPVARVAPCASAADCGGVAGWAKMQRLEFAEPLKGEFALFADGQLMRPAQAPDPKDEFYRDEIDDMAEVDGASMVNGAVTLPHPIAEQIRSGGGRLAMWAKPNRITVRPILSMEGDVAHFDATGLQFYTDRPEKVAVVNHAALIDRPGEYALLPDAKSVVALLPPGRRQVSVATGRGGFHIRGASHLVFRGLGFENMGDGGQLAPGGVAIFADKTDSTDVRIENNRFRNFSMPAGQGPIILRGVSDLRITGNEIESISLGSGMRLSGPAKNILIENNNIRRLGRTGIMLMGVDDAIVRRNRITDVLGVHGNGVSAYLDNHNVRFVANTITGAKQPATFHGAGGNATGDTNILFANNLFVATPDALGSLISWGGETRGVVIRNNVIVGGKTGLRLNSRDTGVTIRDNIVSGLIIAGKDQPDWQIAGNEWTALSFQQKKQGNVSASSQLAGASGRLGSGQVSKEICSIITRPGAGPADAEPDTSRAVGADLMCP